MSDKTPPLSPDVEKRFDDMFLVQTNWKVNDSARYLELTLERNNL
jgi:hypothetical protein